MSVAVKNSWEEKGESGCEGMELDAEEINGPARMVSKLQAMGNETMVQEMEVFLAWVEYNYGINVGFPSVLDFCGFFCVRICRFFVRKKQKFFVFRRIG